MKKTNHPLVASRLAFGFLACLVLTPMAGCSSNPESTRASVNSSARPKTESSPIQATIDLGVIYQGESAGTNRWVQNQSDKSIRIEKIETSCECVSLKFSKDEISPGEKILAQVSYNGEKEPDFVGALQIQVTLLDDNRHNVGIIQVPVEVIKHQ